MPINPIMNGGINAPIEGDDESTSAGGLYALRAASDRALGWTAISLARGAAAGGPTVQQKDAEDALKGQGYDASGVPAEGMSQGALLERMSRQSDIRQSEDIARRAHVGGATQFVAGVAGALGDPLNILLAPAASLVGVRAGLAGRAAIGAVEGAALTGAYETGQNVLGKYEGDPDISSHQMLRDMMLGGGVGGLLHSAFGPRPVAVPGGGPVTLDMIDRYGERTGNFSKKPGIPVDQVVSNKGAMGRYQVEPTTAAEMMGLDGKNPATVAAMRMRLRDPEFNKEMAQKYLDKLNGMFPKDPEAVTIAYNAGPGVAKKFIRSGRDYAVLPEETRAYAARFSGMPRSVRVDGAKTAVAQAEMDSKIDVKPMVDAEMAETYRTNPSSIADEHAAEVSQIESDAFQRAMPKKDSVWTDDKETNDALVHVGDSSDRVGLLGKSEAPVGGESPSFLQKRVAQAALDPELAQHVANDVQEAKSIQDRLGIALDATETEKTAAQFQEPEPHMIDGLPAEDHQKAVEAAVRCGLLKGGFD